ncbi:hypothetical protein MMC25_002563 [Agyrium rufum]|nr:hypothetical protein [Agyrium rufum]
MAALLIAGGALAYDKIKKERRKHKEKKASEAANLTEQEIANTERFNRLNNPNYRQPSQQRPHTSGGQSSSSFSSGSGLSNRQHNEIPSYTEVTGTSTITYPHTLPPQPEARLGGARPPWEDASPPAPAAAHAPASALAGAHYPPMPPPAIDQHPAFRNDIRASQNNTAPRSSYPDEKASLRPMAPAGGSHARASSTSSTGSRSTRSRFTEQDLVPSSGGGGGGTRNRDSDGNDSGTTADGGPRRMASQNSFRNDAAVAGRGSHGQSVGRSTREPSLTRVGEQGGLRSSDAAPAPSHPPVPSGGASQGQGQGQGQYWDAPPPNYEELFGVSGRKGAHHGE